MSAAYAEGAKALTGAAAGDEMAATFLKGYIEHTQKVVELQTSVKRTVFSNSERSSQPQYFTSKVETEAEYDEYM
ncbi:MAG: hypothetical protein ABR585_14565, partial [Gemmatimonadaceae bacterium]